MAWHIPLALGGPVLHWELVRGGRQRWQRLLWFGYAVWLIVQYFHLYSDYKSQHILILMPVEQRKWILQVEPEEENLGHLSRAEWKSLKEIDRLSRQALERRKYHARADFCRDHFLMLLKQQLLLLLLITPLVTGGVLGHEKERGTLAALFVTEMTAWQIVVGKLVGNLVRLLPALVALPVLIILSSPADLGLNPVILGLAQASVLTFTVASLCLLVAVYARRTGDAILACYAVIVRNRAKIS